MPLLYWGEELEFKELSPFVQDGTAGSWFYTLMLCPLVLTTTLSPLFVQEALSRKGTEVKKSTDGLGEWRGLSSNLRFVCIWISKWGKIESVFFGA